MAAAVARHCVAGVVAAAVAAAGATLNVAAVVVFADGSVAADDHSSR